MKISKIEWTESTWNPITGCTKISPGCANCYAERMSWRLKSIGHANYRNGFKLTCHENSLDLPLKWRKPQLIFVNSMSDLFHEDVPEEFIQRIFTVMRHAYWHRFQILTKRDSRMLAIGKNISWPDNALMGVTVETKECTRRIDSLRKTAAPTKFISFEPLLEEISEVDLKGIDWVIVGGESGPGARPMRKEWVLDIKKQCDSMSIPFFFKQWGGVNKKKNGRTLLGRTWDATPNKL